MALRKALAPRAPMITMSQIGKEELAGLTAAVRAGTGLAGFHGTMCDSFRAETEYQFMTGGQWVLHPGNIIDYSVTITRPDDPVMAGIGDFPYRSEQYYMHVDPANEVLATISRTVEYAATMFDDVEFSAEDAFRTEPEFLAEALMAAADAGAQTLNVPDTVGYATPEEARQRFAYLDGTIRPRHADVIFSSHAHNDLGLAVANSLAAVEGGARQIEGAVNGIGERAGNASIEEIIMALRTRADRYGVSVSAESRHLVRASETLRDVTETVIARNKAIVGLNAFAHEAGIHQHGMMADARTYEIMRPEDVGFEGSYFVLGKHSGRHAVGKRAEALGHVLEGQRLAEVFAGFKQRADQIGEINDAELTAIITAVTAQTMTGGASAQMDKTYATAG